MATNTGGEIRTIDGEINNVLFMPCPPLMLFGHLSLHHGLPLPVRQRNGLVGCFSAQSSMVARNNCPSN
jgi:hypothetical protein